MARLLYFGKLADAVGTAEEQRPLPETVRTADALRSWLDGAAGANGALSHPSVRLAVNGAIAGPKDPVTETDEIAFLPPVGGG